MLSRHSLSILQTLPIIFLAFLATAGTSAPQPKPSPTVGKASLQEQASSVSEAATESWREIGDLLKRRVKTIDEEELQIIDARIELRVGPLKQQLGELLDIIDRLDDEGLPSKEPKRVALHITESAKQLLWKNLERTSSAVRRQTMEVRQAALENRLGEERRLSNMTHSLVLALRSVITIAEYRQRLGLDTGPELSRIDSILEDRLERVEGELRVASEKLEHLRGKLTKAGEEEANTLKKELPAREEAFHRSVRDLTDLVELGQRRGLGLDQYKKTLIQATGAGSVGLLNRNVAMGLLRDAFFSVREHVVTTAPLLAFRVIVFLVIVFFFWLISKIVGALTRRIVQRPGAHLPELLRGTVISGSKNGTILLGVVLGLSSMGIQIGPILAGLGIALPTPRREILLREIP